MMWQYVGKCCGGGATQTVYRYFSDDVINMQSDQDEISVSIEEEPVNIEQDDQDISIDASPDEISVTDGDLSIDVDTSPEGVCAHD